MNKSADTKVTQAVNLIFVPGFVDVTINVAEKIGIEISRETFKVISANPSSILGLASCVFKLKLSLVSSLTKDTFEYVQLSGLITALKRKELLFS